MSGIKTNEREGTRAVLRHYQMSASKARLVLDLIRGKDVTSASEILAGTTREAADVIAKVLASAVANAANNDNQAADELYVASAYADEGPTLKRFSPRARGRAGRIKKRSTHITIIVARMDDETIVRLRAARVARGGNRSRRVASSRRRADQQASLNRREAAAAQRAEDLALADEAVEIEESEALEVPEDIEDTEETEVEATTAHEDEDTPEEAEE
jgi:large subunit ribosomal protein L22